MFKSRIESVEKSDREFYEMVISFSVKCLEFAFEKQDSLKLTDEVNRLFRTNAFNMANRQAFEKNREQRFPSL